MQIYSWSWNNQPIAIASNTVGTGEPVLLLPALSTVSSREEMAGVAERLARHFQVTTVDLPGFGDSSRLPLVYDPELYRQFLQAFVSAMFDRAIAVVAAGHSAGYVLQLAPQHLWSKIVLVAPTWRGPLPTMGAPLKVAEAVQNLVRSPLVGQALYWANTTPGFLKLMYGRHVYSDAARLTPEFIAHKRGITQQPGARFAPAAFVTGGLDPVHSRDEFLALAQAVDVPMLAIAAAHAPVKSKAEMDALGNIAGVKTQTLSGTLGLHEEFAPQVADAILLFLQHS